MSDCEECFVTCQVKRLMNRLSQIGIGGTGTILSVAIDYRVVT